MNDPDNPNTEARDRFDDAFNIYEKIRGGQLTFDEFYEGWLEHHDSIVFHEGYITGKKVEFKYQYENFNYWFKLVAPLLWNVKHWDNETIKTWLESAFLDAREIK